jgi:hypothetical protein
MSTTTQLGDAGDVKTQRRNKSDSSLKSLMAVNNLDSYSLPPSLSVTVARSHKRSFARNEKYGPTGANTLTYVLSPGSDFVYGPDSFLHFTVKASLDTGTPTVLSFGDDHTALNLFKEVRITHASGIELEQVSGFNLLNYMKLKYDRSDDWRARYEGPMNPHLNYTTPALFQAALVAGIDVSIPLSVISEMFNMEKLLPSYLLAGLRIELLLEDAEVAFQFTGADTVRVGYEISQPRMYLDSHTLTDSVQKAIARMSAVEGLDVSFPSYYDEVHDISSGTRKTLAISKALSRVQDIRAVHRTTPVTLTKYKDARLTPMPWDLTKWQASIGSMYFPSHEVDKDTVSYNLAVQGLDQNNQVSYADWVKGGRSMLRVQLERSQILTGSGIAISANRGATLIQEFAGVARTINLYVRHTRLVSVFIDNVAVRT